MSAMALRITGVSIVHSTVCSGADQRKHQSSASLAFVRGIHRWPVNSPHKGPVTRKIFPLDDAITDDAEEVSISWRHRVCPACRTYEIATRFWVVVICPIIKCLTVLEFSFILFDLCLFVTIFNFILNYRLIVTFWIFTYHRIWILLIIYCFRWNYWIIYFLTCLDVFWSVVS